MTTTNQATEIESITQAIFKKLQSDSNFDGDIALGFNYGQIFIEFEHETYEIKIDAVEK